MNNYYLIFLLAISLGSHSLLGQRGTEFWFVAPDVTSGHSDKPIFLRVSTYSDPATVVISQPANTSFTPITFNLGSNQTQSTDLTTYISTIENTPANSVLNYGLLIESTTDISAYYEVKSNGNNTDIFSLKAHNALGTHFIVPAQTFWNNSTAYTPAPYSSFELVASEDATTISITPSNDIVGHTAGSTFSIVLDRGQTYSARAISNLGVNHLYGSEINSDKPIAVTISDDSGYNMSYGGCRDIMGDQLIPVSVIGNEYIVVKGFFQNLRGFSLSDKVYITAVRNNTDVFLNGSATAAVTLNKGDQYEVSLGNPDLHILASEDVYVLHISGFGCEAGSAVLPALYCTGSSQVSFTRSKNEDFYLLLLVPAGGQGSFEINDNKKLVSASDFHSVSSSSGQWKVARIKFSTSDIVTGNNYIITNSNQLFHAAIINGGAMTGCMYGYFSDFNVINTDPIFHYN